MRPIARKPGIPIIPFAGLLLLAGILFSSAGFAQEIRGEVRDSTGGAVAYASVNLINRSGDAILAYTTTDTRGGYIVSLPANARADNLWLEVRCIGFKSQRK